MTPAVLVIAALFLAMGVVALLKPAFVGTFFDVRFDSVDGRNEVRAVYGGFGVAMALVLWLAIQQPELRRGVFLTVALALGGMSAGRLASALAERPGAWPWFFCAAEATGAWLLYQASV
jgi:uncharacterized protein DUF4345